MKPSLLFPPTPFLEGARNAWFKSPSNIVSPCLRTFILNCRGFMIQGFRFNVARVKKKKSPNHSVARETAHRVPSSVLISDWFQIIISSRKKEGGGGRGRLRDCVAAHFKQINRWWKFTSNLVVDRVSDRAEITSREQGTHTHGRWTTKSISFCFVWFTRYFIR